MGSIVQSFLFNQIVPHLLFVVDTPLILAFVVTHDFGIRMPRQTYTHEIEYSSTVEHALQQILLFAFLEFGREVGIEQIQRHVSAVHSFALIVEDDLRVRSIILSKIAVDAGGNHIGRHHHRIAEPGHMHGDTRNLFLREIMVYISESRIEFVFDIGYICEYQLAFRVDIITID